MKIVREFWFDTEMESKAFQEGLGCSDSSFVRAIHTSQCPETDSFLVVVEWGAE